MSDSFATPWTVARQAPLSMGFLRQEYWGGLPFTPPGNLPDPETEPRSPQWAGGFFTTEPPGKPHEYLACMSGQRLGTPALGSNTLDFSPFTTSGDNEEFI